jgi:hypothetical protein
MHTLRARLNLCFVVSDKYAIIGWLVPITFWVFSVESLESFDGCV